MNDLYKSLRADSNSVGEQNDCAVIAVAVAAEVPYIEALDTLKAFGRRSRKGTPMSVTQRALSHLGFALHWCKGWEPRGERTYQYRKPVPGSPLHKAKTFCSAERVLRRHYHGQVFLLRSSRHIACFDGQTLQDWSQGRRHRILEIIKVEPR